MPTKNRRQGKVVQWLKTFAAKPESMALILRIRVAEEMT